ncbi:lipocalin family protein [Aequorivita todarodis]|uniref:lipocalin family protein n=1 Tax=Aequorivita todarodis TaxID=2036821 RepID=UPI0023508F48|nr:lipocalin family protein [Aequorivita todarodis]MDC8001607.1 lipocalin family protein [Aequorivita todarodis]
MKTLRTFAFACLALVAFSCSKDDDSSSNTPPKTNLELLTSGKWYQESKTPGNYNACEKKTYLLFKTDGTMTLESFDEDSGTCISSGINNGTYTLTNNKNLSITIGPDSINAVILSISESELKVRNDQDTETLVFDKTEG